MPVQEERGSLIHKRSVVKQRITNLEKKITSLVVKEEIVDYDVVCAKQCLDELRPLDEQFQTIHEKTSELSLENPDLLEKENEELEYHDDRVRENTSKLLFLLSSKPDPKINNLSVNNDDKRKKYLERKRKRLNEHVNTLIAKVKEATENPNNLDTDDLNEYKAELSELVKSLNQLITEIDSSIAVPDDIETDDSSNNWNDICANLYDKLKSNQESLSALISEHRRQEKAREEQEQEKLLLLQKERN